MELNLIAPTQENDVLTVASYRRAHGRSLMALCKLRGAVPCMDELCRISSVETLAPSLWVTATFLDGSKRSFRPESIRRATADEERASESGGAVTECR